MSARNDVPPSTLGVELEEEGVYVEYTDGRRAFYNGVPEKVTGIVRCRPGKDVHVLVTDPTETEGVLVYVNDLKTHDDILESSGVGRVLLDPAEEEELFPGVTVRADGYAIEVEADPAEARGRVFVFEEDELGEYAYELFAAEAEAADGSGVDGEDSGVDGDEAGGGGDEVRGDGDGSGVGGDEAGRDGDGSGAAE